MLITTLGTAAAATIGGTVFHPFSAAAKAPRVGTQAPGFYRMMVGSVEVTAVSDGTLMLNFEEMYLNTSPANVREALKTAFQETPTATSVNTYLLNFGDRLVLLDAGGGSGIGLGRLPENVRHAGYELHQIDDVVISHVHTDHIGGLVADGQMLFPNATLHIPRREAEFWLSEQERANAPEALQAVFEVAAAMIAPYSDAGRLETFDDDASPIPGVLNSRLRSGHTPGHSELWFESDGEKFVYWGDITLGDVIQFDEPDVGSVFDQDIDQARISREAAFVDAAAERYIVAGAHIAFPGVGYLRTDDSNYDFVRYNYRDTL
jgi:glyoxylase-like metal-dependent hydrolase (beta-lactamase superfamily II)